MKPPTTAIGWAHWASRWVAEGGLSVRDGFLLVTLAIFSDPNGIGHATRPTLAARCCCSVPTVARALASLQERGLVIRTGAARGRLQWRLNGSRNPKQLGLEVDHSCDTPPGVPEVSHSRDLRVDHPGDTHSGVNPNDGTPPVSPQGGKRIPKTSNGHGKKPDAEWRAIVDQLRAGPASEYVDVWLSDVQVARNGHGLTIDVEPGMRGTAEQIFSRALPAASAAAGVPVRWAERTARFTTTTTRRRRRREPR